MKYMALCSLFAIAISCNNPATENALLQTRIDSLTAQLSNTYTPGLGEFMSSIQTHHAKLWFAGQNKNWQLADFEIHEMMEAIDNIKKFETDRKETKLIPMIQPAIDSVNAAILQKSAKQFKKSFTLLTNTCNNCHHETNFDFNRVTIPLISTFSNQDFAPPQ